MPLTASQLANTLSAGMSNATFVSQAILNAWGRAATNAEASLYIGQLNGGLSRFDCLNQTVFTDSLFQSRTNAQFITMMYYTILVRDPDAGGLNFWVNSATNWPGQQGLFYVTPQPGPTYAMKLAIIGQAVPPNPNMLGFLGSPEFQGLIQ